MAGGREHSPAGGRKAGPCSCLAPNAQRDGPFGRQAQIERLLVLAWQFPRPATSAVFCADPRHFRIALALRDQMPVVRNIALCSITASHGSRASRHHGPERQPKVSKTAHLPQFIFAEPARAPRSKVHPRGVGGGRGDATVHRVQAYPRGAGKRRPGEIGCYRLVIASPRDHERRGSRVPAV